MHEAGIGFARHKKGTEFMQADLSDRVAIVTGATRGIGRAIALKLAKCNAQVIVGGRDRAAAEEVISAVPTGSPRPVFGEGDLNDYEDMRALAKSTVEQFGRVDILIANGGSRKPGPVLFDQAPPEDLPKYFEGRILTRLYPLHAVLPYMKERKYGKVVLITSDAGRVPTPSESLIGASAAALLFLTRAIGREVARWGIRINTVSTTLTTDTPAWDTYKETLSVNPDAIIVKAFKRIEESSPFGLNSPADIADLALFLSSQESDQISGTTVSINGGLSFP